MKKIILFLLGIALPFIVSAEYKSMMFRSKDGNQHYINVQGLVISFDTENLLASISDNTLSIPLAELISMSFSEEDSAGLESILSDKSQESVSVYFTTGVKTGTFTSVSEAIEKLPAGVYIIQYADGTTLKLAKR